MNTYILTEIRNFKTFWKARKLCNWFGHWFNLKHETEHDIDIAYGV